MELQGLITTHFGASPHSTRQVMRLLKLLRPMPNLGIPTTDHPKPKVIYPFPITDC